MDLLELPKDFAWTVKNGDEIVAKMIIAEAPESKPLRSKTTGRIQIYGSKARIVSVGNTEKEYVVSKITPLKVSNGDDVTKGQPLTEGHYDLANSLKLAGRAMTENYIIKQVQSIYESQGQDINDKHVEVIVRLMLSKVKLISAGGSELLPGQIVNKIDIEAVNEDMVKDGKKKIEYEDVIMGITRVALKTESFLSAASFQETTSILIDAAIAGKVDYLKGLKENVIIGKLIPAGTGFKPED
jgi:DNA-directed RNA polymerase subunit beta'